MHFINVKRFLINGLSFFICRPSALDWEEDEDLQNKLLVDEIGFTYTETGVTEEGEPVCVRNDGYFVNIRILDDLFDVSVFSDYVVELETPLREWS